jgi:hypothetical protein
MSQTLMSSVHTVSLDTVLDPVTLKRLNNLDDSMTEALVYQSVQVQMKLASNFKDKENIVSANKFFIPTSIFHKPKKGVKNVAEEILNYPMFQAATKAVEVMTVSDNPNDPRWADRCIKTVHYLLLNSTEVVDICYYWLLLPVEGSYQPILIGVLGRSTV